MNRLEQLGQIVEALTSGAVNQVRSSVEVQLGGWAELSDELRERYAANLAALLSSLAATKSALTSMAAMLRDVQGTTTEWKLWQTAATAWKTLVTGLGLETTEARRMQLEGGELRGIWAGSVFRADNGTAWRTTTGIRCSRKAVLRGSTLFVDGRPAGKIHGPSPGGTEIGAPILIPVLLFGGTVMVTVGAVAWAWAVIEIAQALQGWVQAYNQELMARVEAMRTGRQLPDSQLKTAAEVVVPQKNGEEEGGSVLPWLLGVGLVIGGGIWAVSRGGR